MRPNLTAVTVTIYARIQDKTYLFNCVSELNGISRASVLIVSGWKRRLQNLLLTCEYCGFCTSCKRFVSLPSKEAFKIHNLSKSSDRKTEA